jgi:hypothetical protein
MQVGVGDPEGAVNDRDQAEKLDDDDHRVLARLGYAVARAQLFELALLKLLEVQRHDLDLPLEERWPEVQKWLTSWTAGKAARELHLAEAIAADLVNVVKRRNFVTHHAWLFYLAYKERHGGGRAATAYIEWLDEQARYLGLAYDGLMALTEMGRAKLRLDLEGDEALPVWRYSVTEPVPKADAPAP